MSELQNVSANRYSLIREGLPAVDMYIHDPKRADGAAPMLVNMHGGCWVGGDATLMETFCEMLSSELGAFVVNMNYQKRPLKPFPFASTEIADTVRYFYENAGKYGIDRTRIAVGGHSAGGQLAASVALMLADEGIAPAAQFLVYPCTDMKKVISMKPFEFLRDGMFPNGGIESRYASPLLCETESLKNAPKAIFILCGTDELCPQGRDYAKKLIDAGVEVMVREYPEALHGFVEVNQPEYPDSDPRRSAAQAEMCTDAEKYIVSGLKLLFARGC